MGNLTDLVFFLKAFAEVPAVLEAEHCGDFTKTARRALRELAKPVESSFLCFVFPLPHIKVSILVAPFEVPSGYLRAAEIDSSFRAGFRRGSVVRARVRRVLGAPSDSAGFKPGAHRTLTLKRPR